MIYDGDKLSKKEASMHLNAKYSEQSNKESELDRDDSLDSNLSSSKKRLTYLKSTEGIVTFEQYPTVMQLKNNLSKFTLSDMKTTTAEAAEDFGDMFDNRGPDGINCINSKFV